MKKPYTDVLVELRFGIPSLYEKERKELVKVVARLLRVNKKQLVGMGTGVIVKSGKYKERVVI